jgi:diphthamide biosynthesis methyltransferase
MNNQITLHFNTLIKLSKVSSKANLLFIYLLINKYENTIEITKNKRQQAMVFLDIDKQKNPYVSLLRAFKELLEIELIIPYTTENSDLYSLEFIN